MFQKYVRPTFEKGWNGYIEDLNRVDANYEMSAINFLPFIHAYPSEYCTIFTAVNQSVTEARQLKMKTCNF